MRAAGGALAGPGGAPGVGAAGLDEASMSQLFVVLKDHADALQRLQDVLRRWAGRGRGRFPLHKPCPGVTCRPAPLWCRPAECQHPRRPVVPPLPPPRDELDVGVMKGSAQDQYMSGMAVLEAA
jgi:hypothetical protein